MSVNRAHPRLDRDAEAESKFDWCCQRLQAGWLVNIDCAAIVERAERKLVEFNHPNFIAIATRDPIQFIATLIAGWRLRLPIFLCDPHWGAAEWQHVNSLTARVERNRDRDRLMIPTGGSSGKVKFAIHTWKTLSASVWGFQEFYQVTAINTVCVLPLYHVSGLMQLWRSLLTGGKLYLTDYHQLSTDTRLLTSLDLDRYFISLVPTQLAKLITTNSELLARFQTILLGGAPPSLELLEAARLARLPLALTYGMTETGSQITSLKPAEFLAGNNSSGSVLPHAEISILSGAIQIRAKSLMLGYFPNINSHEYFKTDDLGTIDDRGYLTILGRNSGKIITGGENVLPIEVVNAILATGLVADVWVVGVPDAHWGQIVTAVYVEGDLPVSQIDLVAALSKQLSRYKLPKYWLKVTEIPRNSLGKIAIDRVQKLAEQRYLELNLPQQSSQ